MGSKLIRLLMSSGFNACVSNSSLISNGLRGGSVIASSACLALAYLRRSEEQTPTTFMAGCRSDKS